MAYLWFILNFICAIDAFWGIFTGIIWLIIWLDMYFVLCKIHKEIKHNNNNFKKHNPVLVSDILSSLWLFSFKYDPKKQTNTVKAKLLILRL